MPRFSAGRSPSSSGRARAAQSGGSRETSGATSPPRASDRSAMIGSLVFALTVAVTFDDLPVTGGERGAPAGVLAVNRAIVATLSARHIPAVAFVNEIG